MARLRCVKCNYIWIRKKNISRGQLIRCPSCRAVLGILSKPIKPYVPIQYVYSKAIDEYAKR